ncbi:MAG: FISUMP domain-containing protein [Ignavibacteria bacterium]|nr:FISUMP domain-containing protein [Ignavibacteria bacterium]
MKKLSVLLMVLLSMSLQSQTWMQIEKISGGKDSVKLTDITKIYFTTTPTVFVCGTSTIDYSGKTYHTVQIGTQCWLRENLDVGTMIQGSDTSKNNGTLEKYCYDNNTSNCATYGGLYQWNEAMQYSTTSGIKGICPTGWHLPTSTEFETLAATVSNNGNALKAIGQGTGSGAGTNTSGFSALFAGSRNSNGFFVDLGYDPHFWSSTEHGSTWAYDLGIQYNGSQVVPTHEFYKEGGMSVRCLKD